jgi:hypothetical protein
MVSTQSNFIMSQLSLHFAQNFNHKLDCEYFTSIRPQRDIYQVGAEIDIYCQEHFQKSYHHQPQNINSCRIRRLDGFS